MVLGVFLIVDLLFFAVLSLLIILSILILGLSVFDLYQRCLCQLMGLNSVHHRYLPYLLIADW